MQGDAAGAKARKESGWVVAVARKVLMPSPHLEAGSHDFVSILATEVSPRVHGRIVGRYSTLEVL